MFTEVLYIGDRLRDLKRNSPTNPAWALPPSFASSVTK
jgi:hypothetical protein